MNVKTLIGSLVIAASALGPAMAQTYPSKTIQLIVPYPAGGPSDFFAHKVQPDAAAKLGQTVIIENIGGAGGAIGMAKLVNAPADGYTLSLGSPMELVLAPMAIQGVKYKSEDFKFPAMAAMKGLETMDFDIWAGVQVHKNTPDAVVNTLNKALYASADALETRKALEASGNVVLPARSPAELARIYIGEIERYRAIAKSINLQAQ